MKRRPIILLAALTFAATVCVAGTAWHYKCETPKCGFEGILGIGGGFIFNKVSGYCSTCKKFVSISWKVTGLKEDSKKLQDKDTNLKENAPEKLGTVWNPASGVMADLYPCPDCKKPFLEIDSFSVSHGSRAGLQKVLCPQCTNLTLRFQSRGTYD